MGAANDPWIQAQIAKLKIGYKATLPGECDETAAQRTIGPKEIQMGKVMIIGVNDHGFQVYPKASPPSDCMHMRINSVR